LIAKVSLPDGAEFKQRAAVSALTEFAKRAGSEMSEQQARDICRLIVEFAETVKGKLVEVEILESKTADEFPAIETHAIQ
jgi:hypothetical protein